MPAPSQRLTSARRSAASSRVTAAVTRPAPSERVVAQKVATEEFIGIPDDAGHSLPLDESSSSTRNAASLRSSRRLAATGSATSNRTAVSGRKSARLPLTPDELAAKRKATRSMLILFAGVVLAVIMLVIAVLALTHKDSVVEAVNSRLATLRVAIPGIMNRAAYDDAKTTLAGIPDLAPMAADKAQATKDLAAREATVIHAEREFKVADNRRALIGQLAKLTDPAVDVDKLAADCQAFVKNPVDPSAAPDPEAAAEFASAVSDVQVRIASVASEKARRTVAATTGASQRIQFEVDALLKDEKFAAAETLVGEAVSTYPKADFAKVRTSISESAASNWANVEVYVDARFKDYATPGITASVRQQALTEAKARLDKVITTWGLPAYVSQAEALKAKY